MAIAGKTVVVTGASDGIGLRAATELAKAGARLHLVGRNPDKMARAALAVAEAGVGTPPTTYIADLSSQQAVRAVAAEILANAPQIDVLLNNAGGVFAKRRLSADGIEMTFALNHLGYFLLTNLLLGALKGRSGARIVNVASDAHVGAQLDFEDLQMERRYSAIGAYKKSKLANIYFTYELASRLDPAEVTINCLHPGFVASNFGGDVGGVLGWVFNGLKNIAALSVEKGAETSIYLCESDGVAGITGKYFVKSAVKPSSPQSQDLEARKMLWAVSERMTGLAP